MIEAWAGRVSGNGALGAGEADPLGRQRVNGRSAAPAITVGPDVVGPGRVQGDEQDVAGPCATASSRPRRSPDAVRRRIKAAIRANSKHDHGEDDLCVSWLRSLYGSAGGLVKRRGAVIAGTGFKPVPAIRG